MLRDYQEKIISEASQHMQQGCRRVLIESPTGSGKTVLTAAMLRRALARGHSSWFMVHRRELIEQTAKTFKKHEIPFGIIAAGHERSDNPIQICSVGTVTRHLDSLTLPHMTAWDECHHIGAESWERIYKACAGGYNIGMSATPIRPGGKTLGLWFDKMVNGPTISWLQSRGFLSQYEYFAPTIPDMSNVSTIGGDYNAAEVEKIMKGKAIVGSIVGHWFKLARGKKTVGFAPTVAASKDYVSAFMAAGVRSAHIDATTPDAERRAICMAFANGEIDVLWNVALFGEGFDLSAYAGFEATIECVILANPTQSLGKHKQEVGRALRPKPLPAVIIDHTGNWLRHGMPDDVIEWSLINKPRRVLQGGTAVPICQCQNCSRVFPPAAICPHCGWEKPVKERPMHYVEGDLKLIKKAEAAALKKSEADQAAALQREVNAARTLPQLLAIQEARGYKNGWAIMKFRSRRRK